MDLYLRNIPERNERRESKQTIMNTLYCKFQITAVPVHEIATATNLNEKTQGTFYILGDPIIQKVKKIS